MPSNTPIILPPLPSDDLTALLCLIAEIAADADKDFAERGRYAWAAARQIYSLGKYSAVLVRALGHVESQGERGSIFDEQRLAALPSIIELGRRMREEAVRH